MIRLETVEDFERVDKALSNTGSKLSEYCVENYGYCGFCKSISIFDVISVFDQDNFTPSVICCRGCQNHFFPDHMGLAYLYCQIGGTNHGTKQIFEFKLGDNIPEEFQKSRKKVFSRGYHRALFVMKLESRITAFKKEQRALASKIRRLAKLRKIRKESSSKNGSTRWALDHLS